MDRRAWEAAKSSSVRGLRSTRAWLREWLEGASAQAVGVGHHHARPRAFVCDVRPPRRTGARGGWLFGRFCHESVTYPRFAQQIAWIGRIELDLLSELPHEHPEVLGLID